MISRGGGDNRGLDAVGSKSEDHCPKVDAKNVPLEDSNNRRTPRRAIIRRQPTFGGASIRAAQHVIWSTSIVLLGQQNEVQVMIARGKQHFDALTSTHVFGMWEASRLHKH